MEAAHLTAHRRQREDKVQTLELCPLWPTSSGTHLSKTLEPFKVAFQAPVHTGALQECLQANLRTGLGQQRKGRQSKAYFSPGSH